MRIASGNHVHAAVAARLVHTALVLSRWSYGLNTEGYSMRAGAAMHQMWSCA